MTAQDVGVQVGYLAAMFVIIAIGFACLLIGSRSRSRAAPGRPRQPLKSGNTLIVTGAVLLAAGALGIAGILLRPHFRSPFDTDKSIRVGECVDQTAFLTMRFSSNPGNDCANRANIYELAFKGGGEACPDGKRGDSVYSRYTDGVTLLCFALNLRQGQCYQPASGAGNLTMRPGDCGEPQPSQTMVVQRIDGSTDTTRCPPGDKTIVYPSPARVYCLAPAGS